MNTFMWILAIIITYLILLLLPDFDRACDRAPAKCQNPAHNHPKP